ncbi:MAG: ATP-dependent RecD-like DNA helicase [Elusimicrobia bacterium]|nr:ATP-dependent RecD-like DNA helicase [Elusimicrobiota bacterium]
MDDSHFEHLLTLLDLEREAEKEENKRELEKYPLQVREALGKTVTRLQIVDEDSGVGGMPLLRLRRSTLRAGAAALSPFHAMNQGDNVRLSYPVESGLKPIDGTLYDVQEMEVTVAINGYIPDPWPDGLCQLDLLGSDATYKRMRQALGMVRRTEKPALKRLREIFLGNEAALKGRKESFDLFNLQLNKYQIMAVEKSLAAEEVALIHGPPGTGKTTVLMEIILQTVRRGGRVLASAPSNIAVDNMVEKLLPWNLRVVRMGHPARIMDSLRHVTLSAQEQEHALMDQIRRMDDERHRLQIQLRRRENRGGGLRGDDRHEIQSMIQALRKEINDMEFGLRRQIIQDAQVVLCTHGGVGGALSRQKFDLLVMDEASQATEPLSWIPMTLAKKVVFAGDTHQLPPTIYSKEAAEQGLSSTIFDRMKENLDDDFQSLLRVQYRMHETIMRFSSDKFYEGKLIADDSVRAHTASELKGAQETELTRAPLVYVDTAGTGYGEEWNELLESRENEGEAQLALKILDELKASGIEPHDIALITPYVAQVKKLKLMLPDRSVEIGSIDSFQGREKEVVIVSLVRSNEKGEVGFLSDTRRMNVGMTRARRLLIVIGDSGTISRHPFYSDFLSYVEKINAHRSAWEWIKQ